MYRYSDLQKLKKDDVVQISRVNSIFDENVNSRSFTKKRLLGYLCLQYAYHFCLTEIVMRMRAYITKRAYSAQATTTPQRRRQSESPSSHSQLYGYIIQVPTAS